MLNLSLNIQLSNVVNLILGVILGFFLMVMIACAFLSKSLKKHNKNEKIREISNKAYNDFYLKEYKVRDSIIKSLLYEVKEISQLCHKDKKQPIYELSINDVLAGIRIIQKKLKYFTNHPLCKDIKRIHISTLLTLEEKVAKPTIKVYKSKITKFALFAYKIISTVFNLINPVFYMKKIMNHLILKHGKKELIIIALDFVGNTTYEIYGREKDLQNNSDEL